MRNSLRHAGRNPRYTYGDTYTVVPPILRDPLTGQTAIVFPPIGGVISYVMLSSGTSGASISMPIDTFLWSALIALTVVAAAKSSRTLGLV
jgi:hypothetical protein